MQFKELTQKALAIKKAYHEYNVARGSRAWSGEEAMLGFVTDVGELSELVQAKEGIREVADVDQKLAHELSDCLWSVMILADAYGVNLESSFLRTMSELEARIDQKRKELDT
jgi:NTP pyrophosphatase (non-canonical NTP hydrolase)